jgi:hypothetical protein
VAGAGVSSKAASICSTLTFRTQFLDLTVLHGGGGGGEDVNKIPLNRPSPILSEKSNLTV